MHDSHPSIWVRESSTFDDLSTGLPESATVVLIGAGVAGVSAALALARAGLDPVILEAGNIAARASGRNDGQILLGLGEHYNRIVGQFGREQARILWDYIQENNRRTVEEVTAASIDCGFEQAGGLRFAETEHEAVELRESAALLSEEGIDHELLSAAEATQRLPAAEGFHGALSLPGECVVQPAALVRGLAKVAQAAGAMFYQQRTVVAVDEVDGEYVVRTADGGSIRCAIVVHCTSTLARELDSSGFLARQVFPFRGQIIATDALPKQIEAQFGNFAMSSNFCYEYFRVHNGRFVVGGMRWSVNGEEQDILDDGQSNPEITQNLRSYVDQHFPILAGTEFPHVWTGIMAGTGDGLPLCGALPDRPGTFALLGFNGYGLSFAVQAGVSLSQQIVDGRAADAAVSMLLPRRFR